MNEFGKEAILSHYGLPDMVSRVEAAKKVLERC
jgi:hypothetical protein